MSTRYRLALCLLMVALVPGCGSIFGLGFPRGVEIKSNPGGGTIYLNGKVQEETTPANIGVWSGEDQVVEVRVHGEDGVELRGQTMLTRGVRIGIVFMDIVFTGGLGLLIDWLSGAMYYFDRDQVVINCGNYEQVANDARERNDPGDGRDTPQTIQPADLPPDLPPDEPGGIEPAEAAGSPSAIDGSGDDEPIGPDPTLVDPLAGPCEICNQPRGDVSPCPHCGMD